mgnify:FL=1
MLLPELQQPTALQIAEAVPSVVIDTGNDDVDYKNVHSYRKNAGGALMREDGSPTVFVVRDNWKMGISHPDWLTWMQFDPSQVQVVAQGFLSRYEDAGATPDPIKIITGEIDREYH